MIGAALDALVPAQLEDPERGPLYIEPQWRATLVVGVQIATRLDHPAGARR